MKKKLLISSLCLLAAGSGLKLAFSPANADTPAVNNPSPVVESTQAAPATRSQLQLLDAGAEPRQELRFSPVVNAKQTLTITTNLDMVTAIAGQPIPSFKIPASRMTMETVVTQVDPNGDIHFDFSYTDGDVVADSSASPEVVNAVRSTLQKMVGIKGSYVIDNRGQVKSTNVDLPEDLDPRSKQLLEQVFSSLEQLSSPVPEEAVGIGAKWRVSSSPTFSGMNLNQNTVYELVSLQDNVATLNANIEQEAASQNLSIPGLPTTAKLNLKSLDSQGQGQVVMQLDEAMPMRSSISIRSNTAMDVEMSQGKTTPIETNLTMQINLESQP
ncbi:MAG: hypothetical protein KME06_15895 [Kastovskya adunca ATA6-11-RM4]|jgi:hypothetical protein|nr:hypothetical protein [Kastovskya adunca ATA6-11-RM4]